MNIKSGLVFLIVLAAGLIGGTVAYQVATPTSSSAEPTANGTIVLDKKQRSDKPRGFAPCKQPATLQGGRCVTDVTRTVVVPGAAAPAQSSRGRAPAPVPFQASGGDDEGRQHGGENENGQHGDDDADDDHDDDTDTGFTQATGTGSQDGGDDDDDTRRGNDDGDDDSGDDDSGDDDSGDNGERDDDTRDDDTRDDD